MKSHCTALLLATVLILSACQGGSGNADNPVTAAVKAASDGIDEAQKGMDQAKEELEKERAKLNTQNLSLNRDDAHKDLPKAEITPQGELLIDGKAVAATPEQKQLVLAYRGQMLGVISAGIAVGIEGAKIGMDAAGAALKGLISNKSEDEIGKEVEAKAKARLQPEVEKLCARLPGLYAAQQSLADKMPEFRPYATMDKDDIDDCKDGGDWEP